jgi:hypothetical protein
MCNGAPTAQRRANRATARHPRNGAPRAERRATCPRAPCTHVRTSTCRLRSRAPPAFPCAAVHFCAPLCVPTRRSAFLRDALRSACHLRFRALLVVPRTALQLSAPVTFLCAVCHSARSSPFRAQFAIARAARVSVRRSAFPRPSHFRAPFAFPRTACNSACRLRFRALLCIAARCCALCAPSAFPHTVCVSALPAFLHAACVCAHCCISCRTCTLQTLIAF